MISRGCVAFSKTKRKKKMTYKLGQKSRPRILIELFFGDCINAGTLKMNQIITAADVIDSTTYARLVEEIGGGPMGVDIHDVRKALSNMAHHNAGISSHESGGGLYVCRPSETHVNVWSTTTDADFLKAMPSRARRRRKVKAVTRPKRRRRVQTQPENNAHETARGRSKIAARRNHVHENTAYVDEKAEKKSVTFTGDAGDLLALVLFAASSLPDRFTVSTN